MQSKKKLSFLSFPATQPRTGCKPTTKTNKKTTPTQTNGNFLLKRLKKNDAVLCKLFPSRPWRGLFVPLPVVPWAKGEVLFMKSFIISSTPFHSLLGRDSVYSVCSVLFLLHWFWSLFEENTMDDLSRSLATYNYFTILSWCPLLSFLLSLLYLCCAFYPLATQ